MVADKAKKSKLAETGQDVDVELVFSVEKLQGVQDELEKVNEEASDKVLEVEHKYNEIRKPVYDRRNEIIKTIPDFWLTAFLSHPALCDLLTEEDQKTFKYLDSLDVEDFKDLKLGYSITFDAANGVHHETKGNKRPLDFESFFSWFIETQLKNLAEFGDEVAEIIKEDLWPNPLKYFNNEADEEDMDGDGDEEENGEDEDEENSEDGYE